ncbi:G protein-coupled glucose receptor regulating Gpa2-domain-containing protein [Aspergillus coremiiformis]|uniref:G protein-coupled glucose receptor regulating Gpa2-domain-containing protein n=1 Tax=Aspergillus coremiiformis TaxID=138285 RepID=A0A5N6Z884_9EURO|nr:G protein-coupled glucose receptor regulating Gpa2-domain-containing protein [Aspergillus coremiiformis]
MSLFQVLNARTSSDDSEGQSLSPQGYTDAGLIMDIGPLPSAQRNGLIAVSIMAILSFLASLILLMFVTYRLIFWRSNYARYIGYNQYIILIYNLVLADLQQSVAFLICLRWIAKNKIEASSAACFLQGLWLQIGDPSSGLFVLAIAVHTFLLVALGHKLSHRIFVSGVVGVWVFVAILVIIPLASHGRFVFIPSGAWCWISEEYEPIRLWTHYIWIFLAEFGTVCLYAIMWFQLRRRIKQSAILGSSQTDSLRHLRRVIGYMIIYPIAYIVLSLPLAAGRMATAQGQTPSAAYFCVAGALITSSGLVDVLLYTLTRRNLILESEPSCDPSYNRFHSKLNPKTDHITITAAEGKPTRPDISVLCRNRHHDDDELGLTVREGSPANPARSRGLELTPLRGKVYQHTTIEITHEPAYPGAEGSDRSFKDFIANGRSPEQSSSSLWRR